MSTLRVINATILPLAGGSDVITDGELVAEDGEIVYVGPRRDMPQEADEIIDAAGDCMLPGFVNAHTHAAMTLLRGFADDLPLQTWLQDRIWPIEENLVEDDVYWGTMLGAVEMLAAGITCYCDMYHYFQAGTRAAIDSGMRVRPSGVLLQFSDDPEALMQEAFEFTIAMKTESPDRIMPVLGPHAAYSCTDEMLKKVASVAREHDLPVHIHISETAQEVSDILDETGMRPVEYLDTVGILDTRLIGVHCVHLSDHEIERLVETDSGVVHCPTSNMKLASGFAPVREFVRADANIGLGTDGAASNNRLDIQREASLAALIHKGYLDDSTALSAEQTLTMATVGGARALHIDHLVGSLEVGKRADFILLSLEAPHNRPLHNICSQIIYAANARDVWCTVVDGEVLYRNGEYPQLDAEKIIAHAEECAERLIGDYSRSQQQAST
ncbi:MAG: amidohydrolase [Armatimonadota bacterium]